MPFNIGTSAAKKVYWGTTEIKKIFSGTTQVWTGDDEFIYVADGSGYLAKITKANGSISAWSSKFYGGTSQSLISDSSFLYFVAGSMLYKVDKTDLSTVASNTTLYVEGNLFLTNGFIYLKSAAATKKLIKLDTSDLSIAAEATLSDSEGISSCDWVVDYVDLWGFEYQSGLRYNRNKSTLALIKNGNSLASGRYNNVTGNSWIATLERPDETCIYINTKASYTSGYKFLPLGGFIQQRTMYSEPNTDTLYFAYHTDYYSSILKYNMGSIVNQSQTSGRVFKVDVLNGYGGQYGCSVRQLTVIDGFLYAVVNAWDTWDNNTNYEYILKMNKDTGAIITTYPYLQANLGKGLGLLTTSSTNF